MMLTVTGVRHSFPEAAGFCLCREHGHPDYSFVHFCTEVSVFHEGRMQTLPPHTCLIWRPGTKQLFSSSRPMLHDWFHFRTDEPVPLPLDTLLYPRQTEFITALVHEIEIEFNADRPGREQMIDLKANELFIKLQRELSAPPTARPVHVSRATHKALHQLRQEVFHSLHQPWTVQLMADRIGLSASRFHEIYRHVYSCSPIDDLIRARIDSARHMLLYTDQTISSIAEAVGYANQTHFIRQFKQYTGSTPGQYRREFKNM